ASYLALASGPERIAQAALRDLAGTGLRQLVLGEIDRLRDLVGRDLAAAKADDFIGRRGGTFAQHADRLHRFAPLRIGHAARHHLADLAFGDRLAVLVEDGERDVRDGAPGIVGERELFGGAFDVKVLRIGERSDAGGLGNAEAVDVLRRQRFHRLLQDAERR